MNTESQIEKINTLTYATIGQRFFANLLDKVIHGIYFCFTLFFFIFLLVPLSIHYKLESLVPFVIISLVFIAQILYLYTFYKWKKNTPGKILLKIQVKNSNGHEISFVKFIVRYFLKFILNYVLAVGALFCFTNDTLTSLYDYFLKLDVFKLIYETENNLNTEQNPRRPIFNKTALTIYITALLVLVGLVIYSPLQKQIDFDKEKVSSFQKQQFQDEVKFVLNNEESIKLLGLNFDQFVNKYKIVDVRELTENENQDLYIFYVDISDNADALIFRMKSGNLSSVYKIEDTGVTNDGWISATIVYNNIINFNNIKDENSKKGDVVDKKFNIIRIY